MACAADVECLVLYPCLLLLYLHGLKKPVLSFTLSGKHIQGRPITLIVTSLIVYLIYFIYYLLYHILCNFPILSCHFILSCTFIYILILFMYGTFVCFNLVLFMCCTFICLLPVLVFFIYQFYDLLHSIYYYIYHLLSYTYIKSPFM